MTKHLTDKILLIILVLVIFAQSASAESGTNTDYTMDHDVTVGSSETYALQGASNTANYNLTNNGTTTIGGNTNAGSSVLTNQSDGGFFLQDTPYLSSANIINNGTIDLSNITSLSAGAGSPIGTTVGSLNNNGIINLGSIALGVGNNNNNDIINGTVTGGTFAKIGTGTMNFNTNYTGDIHIENTVGTLNLNGAGGGTGPSYGSYNGVIYIDNGNLNISNSTLTNRLETYYGTANLNNTAIIHPGATGLLCQYDANINLNTGSFVKANISNINDNTINFNNNSYTQNATIDNYSDINFNNNSHADTTAIKNYGVGDSEPAILIFNDNAAMINGGSIRNELGASVIFNAQSSLGSSVVTNYGSFTLSANATSNNARIVNTGMLNISGLTASTATIGSLSTSGTNSVFNMGGKALILGGLNQTDTLAGTINNPGVLTKNGTGTLNLNVNYLPNITTTGGTFNINNARTANLNVTASNAIVNYIGNSSATTGIVNNSGTVNMRNISTLSSSIFTNNSGANLNFNNTSTANTATIINSGTLSIAGLSAGAATIGSLNSTGVFNMGTKALTLGGLNQTDTLAGTINNPGVLTKNGTGTLNLSANYLSAITASSGTLNINNAQTANLTVAGGAIANYLGASSATTGMVTNNGILNFNDTSAASNATIANTGTLSISGLSDSSSTIGSLNTTGTFNMANKALILGGLNQTDTLAGTVNNAGTLTKNGMGVLNLNVNYLPDITINGGALNINNAQTANLNVASSATVNYTGTANATTGMLNNSGTLSFKDNSTAGSSTIITNDTTNFLDSSTGGTTRLITNLGGLVDISGINGGSTEVGSIEVGSIEGAGNYYLGSRSLITGSNNLDTTVSGVIYNVNGFLTKTGTGTLTLTNANIYTGGTTVAQGKLVVNGSIDSPVMVQVAGTLGGNGVVNGNATNLGNITPGTTASIGNLTINGDYVGTNGNLAIRLNGTNNDKLIINNNPSNLVNGTTFINLSGSGIATSLNGIEIIETKGSETNAFALSNSTLGAYNYTLRYQDLTATNDNWYLTTNLREDFDIYNTINPIIRQYGASSMSDLNDDIGKDKRRFWSRAFGTTGKRQNNDNKNQVGYSYDSGGIQMGYTAYNYSNNHGNVAGGVYGLVGKAKGKEMDATGVSTSDIDIYSIGAYSTYSNSDRWRLDLIAQASRYDIKASTFAGDSISPEGYGIGLSAEASRSINLTKDFTIKPQAQVIHQLIDLRKTRNSISTVTFGGNDSLRAKVGATASYDVRLKELGEERVVTPYAIVNFWHEFNKINSVTLADLGGDGAMKFSNHNPQNWIEYGLGVKGAISKSTEVYASINYQATPNFKSYDTTGRVGIRINF